MGIYKTGIWSEGSIYERTLPEGYTELEYLESSGTQYINTGFIPNAQTSMELEFSDFIVKNDYGAPLGARNGDGSNQFWFFIQTNNSRIYSRWLSSHYDTGYNYIANTKIKTKYSKYGLFINDTFYPLVFSGTDFSNLTSTIWLFALNNGGSIQYGSTMKIHSFKLWDNNKLVRNMMPAQRNSDSVLGMYDIVNNIFYTNSGTGTFIAGPIVETSSANVQIFKQKLPDTANIITESDGSKWVQLFHHNNPTGGLFSLTDTFATGVYKDTNKWFNMNLCNKFNKWEILFKQKTTSDGTEEKYRWIQTVNPMIATFDQTKAANVTFITTEGYTTPGSSYGGLWYKNASTYLSANNNASSNWYGAVGSWTAWNSGTPGYNGKTVTSGYMDVYLRIDNDSISDDVLNRLLIKNEYIEANNFIEI